MPIKLPAEKRGKPDTWTQEDGKRVIDAIVSPAGPEIKTQREVNAKFVAGDHWQDGEGWVGPNVQPGDQRGRIILHEIRKAFTTRNAIKEVVERRGNGTVGTPPGWAFVPRRAIKPTDKPTPAESDKAAEISALLTQWVDARKVATYVQEVTETAITEERVVLRFLIPRGLLEKRKGQDGKDVYSMPAGDIGAQLSRIYIDRLGVASAVVATDEETMERVGAWIYAPQGIEAEQTLELVYVDGEDTVLRQVTADGKSTTARVRIGKRLTMYELAHPRFITEQMRQAQRALNLALTCIPKGLTDAGWLEETMLNGQPPGDWQYDGTGNPIPGTYTPGTIERGPNIIRWVRGLATKDEDGKETLTTPQLTTKEPSSIENAAKAKDVHYRDILSEAGQEHVLLTGEAMPSGKSREQARADYRATLTKTEQVVVPALQWLLECALALAEFYAGTPGKYTNDFRAVVSCRLDTGPLSDTERTADGAAVDAGRMARQTAMERGGIADVDAEDSRMADDPRQREKRRGGIAEALANLTGAGASLTGAAQYLELTAADITKLTAPDPTGDTGEPEREPGEDEPPADAPIPPADIPTV